MMNDGNGDLGRQDAEDTAGPLEDDPSDHQVESTIKDTSAAQRCYLDRNTLTPSNQLVADILPKDYDAAKKADGEYSRTMQLIAVGPDGQVIAGPTTVELVKKDKWRFKGSSKIVVPLVEMALSEKKPDYVLLQKKDVEAAVCEVLLDKAGEEAAAEEPPRTTAKRRPAVQLEGDGANKKHAASPAEPRQRPPARPTRSSVVQRRAAAGVNGGGAVTKQQQERSKGAGVPVSREGGVAAAATCSPTPMLYGYSPAAAPLAMGEQCYSPADVSQLLRRGQQLEERNRQLEEQARQREQTEHVRLLQDKVMDAVEKKLSQQSMAAGSMGPGLWGGMGPGAAGNMGPGMWGSMGPGAAASMGTGMWGSMGPGAAASMGPGAAASMGPGMWGSMGPGAAASMGPGAAASMGPGAAASMGPGMWGSMGPGAAASMGPGMWGRMGPGALDSMGPGVGGGMAAGVVNGVGVSAMDGVQLGATGAVNGVRAVENDKGVEVPDDAAAKGPDGGVVEDAPAQESSQQEKPLEEPQQRAGWFSFSWLWG